MSRFEVTAKFRYPTWRDVPSPGDRIVIARGTRHEREVSVIGSLPIDQYGVPAVRVQDAAGNERDMTLQDVRLIHER